MQSMQPSSSCWRRLGDGLYRHPGASLFLLLAPPLIWFGVVYLGSLFTLLLQSVFTFDDFTMNVSSALTWSNYRALLAPTNYDVVLRTVGMAAVRNVGDSLVEKIVSEREANGHYATIYDFVRRVDPALREVPCPENAVDEQPA